MPLNLKFIYSIRTLKKYGFAVENWTSKDFQRKRAWDIDFQDSWKGTLKEFVKGIKQIGKKFETSD